MNRLYIPIACLLLLGSQAIADVQRPRLIILADMGNEPDEEQQMAHMLVNRSPSLTKRNLLKVDVDTSRRLVVGPKAQRVA